MCYTASSKRSPKRFSFRITTTGSHNRISTVDMVAIVSAAEWQRSQDALRDEVRRVTTLMRSITDPGVPAVGQWNIAEVAMHLSQNWILVPGKARQDLSRYKAV